MKTKRPYRLGAGFSLVEMLVVIAVIGILTGLAVPAFNGLVGVSGVRGGVDLVSGAFDNARNVAVEKGVNAYVGFLPDGFGGRPEDAASHLILFRDATVEEQDDDPSLTFVPVSRWLTLPTGVMMKFTSVQFDSDELPTSPAQVIPQFGGSDVENMRVIKFDRFGRIVTGPTGAGQMHLEVGDAVHTGSDVAFKGNKRERFVAQRLTGKWTLEEFNQ